MLHLEFHNFNRPLRVISRGHMIIVSSTDDLIILFFFVAFFLSFFYLFIISFMEKRKAYNLKWLLAFYNLAQVAVCCHLIIGLVSNEFNVIKFWQCQSVDYKNSLKATTALTYTYQTFLLKLVELVETVFFVLRKKQNQVSKLHVYHHVSTATLAWILVKYTAGQSEMISYENEMIIQCKRLFCLHCYYVNDIQVE